MSSLFFVCSCTRVKDREDAKVGVWLVAVCVCFITPVMSGMKMSTPSAEDGEEETPLRMSNYIQSGHYCSTQLTQQMCSQWGDQIIKGIWGMKG